MNVTGAYVSVGNLRLATCRDDDDDDANEEADDVVDEAEYGDGDGARLVAAVGLRLPLLAFAPNLVGATSRVVPLKLLLRAVVVVVVVFVDAGTVR